MLARRLRRRPNNKSALVQRIVIAGNHGCADTDTVTNWPLWRFFRINLSVPSDKSGAGLLNFQQIDSTKIVRTTEARCP